MDGSLLGIVIASVIIIVTVIFLVFLFAPTQVTPPTPAPTTAPVTQSDLVIPTMSSPLSPTQLAATSSVPFNQFQSNRQDIPSPYMPLPSSVYPAPNPYLPNQQVPQYAFSDVDIPQREEGNITEMDGTVIAATENDNQYQLSSSYPGMVGGGIMLLYPQRREVHLCKRGGFIRRYGNCNNGEWRHIPYIIVDGRRVGYDGNGYFLVGSMSSPYVIIKHGDIPYIVEVVARR